MPNFTMLDTFGALRAIAAFSAILLAPGYVVACALDLFSFRRRSMLERGCFGIALSFAISPILTQLIGRIVPDLFTICAAVWLALMLSQWRHIRIPRSRDTFLLALFLLFGAALILAELIDIQRGNRLFLSVTVLDQAFRVAFTNSIAHLGLPPTNPLYHPGELSPMRYYYFWYALCAVCMKLAHVSARQALIGSSVWAAVGLVAVIALFARHFLNIRTGLHRYILSASLLLTVTGLDILPVLYNLFVRHSFSGDLEWWSADQISSWLDSILWVPNHLASLLACLTAFLLLWRTRDSSLRPHKIAASILAGIAAASALGLSVYVAAGFAMLMFGWTLTVMRDRVLLRRMAVAVTVAAILAIPYLRELTSAHSGTEQRAAASPSHMFQLSVRSMLPTGSITGLPALNAFNLSHPVLLDQLARLVLMIPGYIFELGVYGLVLMLAFRSRNTLDYPRRTARGLALGSLILVSFVRSSVIGNNDFGYRAALLPSFFLLLLTADILTGGLPKVQTQVLSLLIFIGLAGTAFQALMLRLYVPLHVSAHMPGFAELPQQAFAARSAYDAAAAITPQQAIVQASLTDPRRYSTVLNILFSERGMATDAEVDCGAVFGGDPALCSSTQKEVNLLFFQPIPSASQAEAICLGLGIDYLSVARTDPAWDDRHGWVWTLPLVSQSPNPVEVHAQDNGAGVRIVNCRNAAVTKP
jgi:hypothetical protein